MQEPLIPLSGFEKKFAASCSVVKIAMQIGESAGVLFDKGYQPTADDLTVGNPM